MRAKGAGEAGEAVETVVARFQRLRCVKWLLLRLRGNFIAQYRRLGPQTQPLRYLSSKPILKRGCEEALLASFRGLLVCLRAYR